MVVLDNASYHNVKTEDTVCPNFSQKKAVLQNYLTQVNNDQFNQTDDQDNHKLNETCLNRQASNYCTFDNLSKSLPYLEIPLLIQQQKCNQQNISTVDNTKSVLENKSVTCIKDKEKNDIKLVDTCNFNARM